MGRSGGQASTGGRFVQGQGLPPSIRALFHLCHPRRRSMRPTRNMPDLPFRQFGEPPQVDAVDLAEGPDQFPRLAGLGGGPVEGGEVGGGAGLVVVHGGDRSRAGWGGQGHTTPRPRILRPGLRCGGGVTGGGGGAGCACSPRSQRSTDSAVTRTPRPMRRTSSSPAEMARRTVLVQQLHSSATWRTVNSFIRPPCRGLADRGAGAEELARPPHCVAPGTRPAPPASGSRSPGRRWRRPGSRAARCGRRSCATRP